MTDRTTASLGEGTVNFYDELDLNPDDSAARLLEHLEQQRLGWLSRAGRSGEQGARARQRLLLIEQAQAAFTDDDARAFYDNHLSREREQGQNTTSEQIDWQDRAWSYYYMGDFGAAEVAARKAREAAPNDPMPYVVSTWVALAENDTTNARQFADEAFVLGGNKENTVDVNHARAATYKHLEDTDRARHSINQAINSADSPALPVLLTFRASLCQKKSKHLEALIDYLQAIYLSPNNTAATTIELVPAIRRLHAYLPPLSNTATNLRS